MRPRQFGVRFSGCGVRTVGTDRVHSAIQNYVDQTLLFKLMLGSRVKREGGTLELILTFILSVWL